MVTHISIKNYALIQSLEIDFGKGLSVITGETGAGKSILLGAINLILGKRADTKVLLDKSKKCIVEGTFEIKNYFLQDFFAKHDLDYDDRTFLRREITPYGKSRAFINDTPVNLNILKNLGDKLIDIHSQHQMLTLNDTNFRLAVIDSFAGIASIVNQYKSDFLSYQKLRSDIKELIEEEKRSKAEQDYFQFLFNELENAGLTEGEQLKLEQELEIFEHAEDIKNNLYSALSTLENEETGTLASLSLASGNLSKIENYSDKLSETSKRLESTSIELRDIANEIGNLEQQVSYDPGKAEKVSDRLNELYRLEQKHRVKTVEELIDIHNELSEKLLGITSLEESIKKLNSKLEKKKTVIFEQAEKISAKRINVFNEFESEIEKTLSDLGMPDSVFKIDRERLNNLSLDGVDSIKFLFNANRGGELQDLSKIASGGELSRLMLAVKSLISKKNLLPTVIFDEIDIGVSGNIADKMGNILLKLSKAMQVIAITHLPQIAGKGNTHYIVYKVIEGEGTKTIISQLNANDRIIEVAKMLSGQDITTASVETAKQLLKN
jgi:DNA repair protein RecN (Recombination protein N)